MSHRSWISVSGFIWAIAGILLLYKGAKILSNEESGSLWLAAAVFLGFLKGRFILSKTVQRISNRIFSLPLPIRWVDAYPKSYWLLISCMMLLGLLMRLVPSLWHGFIDVAIGSALLYGAMLYFRKAQEVSAQIKR